MEIDATALQFDERNIADPLLGSVHDPIYQGGRGRSGRWASPSPDRGRRCSSRSIRLIRKRQTEPPVPNTLALTGEIGLHGQILPVGGVEDKLEAAQQAGATLALIPQENWREVYREIEVVPVGDAETLLRRVFPPGEGATLSEGMEFLVGQEIG